MNMLFATFHIFGDKNSRFQIIKKHPYFVNRNSIRIEQFER